MSHCNALESSTWYKLYMTSYLLLHCHSAPVVLVKQHPHTWGSVNLRSASAPRSKAFLLSPRTREF